MNNGATLTSSSAGMDGAETDDDQTSLAGASPTTLKNCVRAAKKNEQQSLLDRRLLAGESDDRICELLRSNEDYKQQLAAVTDKMNKYYGDREELQRQNNMLEDDIKQVVNDCHFD